MIAPAAPHRLTGLAILVCIVSVIPAMVVGYLAKVIYGFFLRGYTGGSWTAIGEFVDALALEWFPSLLQMVIAGALAIGLTSVIFKRSNIEIVAYATMTAYCVLMGFGYVLHVAKAGFALLELVALAAQLLGLALGLQVGRGAQLGSATARA
jgi:hypothetical protein